MNVSQFNDTVNSGLAVFRTNVVASNILKLSLIMYGGLAAPKINPKYAPYLSNPFARLAVMSLVIWTVDYDAGLAIIIATAFILTTKYLTANAVTEAKIKGKVTSALQSITGGQQPKIKTVTVSIGSGTERVNAAPVRAEDSPAIKGAGADKAGPPEAYIPDGMMMLANANA